MACPIQDGREPGRKTHGRSSLGAAALSFSESACATVVTIACRWPYDVGVPLTQWSAHWLGDYVRRQGIAISDHFTPTHASWLNQIECAFSILGKHVLSRRDFDSKETLKTCVYDYLIWFNEQDEPPFEWTYRPAS